MIKHMTLTYQLLSLLIVSLLLLPQAHAATGTLRLDLSNRTLIQGEGVILRLRYSGVTSGGADLDPTPLTAMFDIVDMQIVERGSETTSNFRGTQTRLYQTWKIIAFPSKTGEITVPPLSAYGVESNPITIKIIPSNGHLRADGKPRRVFTEASVDRNEVYVNAQVITKHRVYILANQGSLRGPGSTPQPDQAIINELGRPTSGSKKFGDATYRYIERTHVVHPQASGTLTIPAIIFQTRVRELGNYSLSNMSTDEVLVRTKQFNLKVLPQQSPAGQAWLPVSKLTLTDSWDQPVDKLRLGEPVTRTIITEAIGIDAASLPQITMPKVDGLGIFPSKKPDLNNAGADEGIIGKQSFDITIIPKRAGKITLPNLSIEYWDVNKRQMKTASIAGIELNIIDPNAGTSSSSGNDQPAISSGSKPTTNAANQASTGSSYTWLWVGLWLATVGLLIWREFTRRNSPSPSSPIMPPVTPNLSKRILLKKIHHACQNNHAKTAHQLFLQWSEEIDPTIFTIGQLAKQVGGNLSIALRELDAYLYAPTTDSDDWQGSELSEAFNAYLEQDSTDESKRDTGSPLPDLYN